MSMWAAPGPMYLRSDGSMDDAEVGWPAIQGVQPPDSPGISQLIREAPHDITE